MSVAMDSASGNVAQPPRPMNRTEPEESAAAIELAVPRQSRVAHAIKRLFDVLSSALGLMLAAPLVAVLAALIRLDSRGPALFRAPRMGRAGRPFTMIKLRTMNTAGEVTRMGRLLRPSGLDELPQLWHVLTGEMSVIGPRPEVLERALRYEVELPQYRARHLMRPGITGWAQVNGLRGEGASIPGRLDHDLQYLRAWTLALDARILWRTAATVWRDTRRDLRR